MDGNEFLGGRTPEQDAAADDVEPNPDAGVPGHERAHEHETAGEGEGDRRDDLPVQRAEEPQAGL